MRVTALVTLCVCFFLCCERSSAQLTRNEKQDALDFHNDLRRRKGASDMLLMVRIPVCKYLRSQLASYLHDCSLLNHNIKHLAPARDFNQLYCWKVAQILDPSLKQLANTSMLKGARVNRIVSQCRDFHLALLFLNASSWPIQCYIYLVLKFQLDILQHSGQFTVQYFAS